MYSFSYLEPVCCFTSSSNCCCYESVVHTDLSRGRSNGLVFPSLTKFSTVYCDLHSQSFGIVNKAEVDVFLIFSCLFDNPMDVGNLISGSSAFLKSSWNIWKFLVHVLLKPGLQNFEHYFASVKRAQLCGCLNILWHCLSLGLE